MLLIIIFVCIVNSQILVDNRILATLKEELAYESILVLQNSLVPCEFNLHVDSATPMVNLNDNQNFLIKSEFNRRFLALVCLDKLINDTMVAVSTILDGMRDTATIFLVSNGVNLENVFKDCFKNKMLNVMAIADWNRNYIYSYRAFPRFMLIKRYISDVKRYFDPQIKNMGGHPIMSMPDNVLPRSVYYKDIMGQPQLTGYLEPFLNNFAQTLNATVKIRWNHIPLDMPEEMIGGRVMNSVARGLVDIPLCITTVFKETESSNFINSYVMEISKWQLILPLEPELNSELLIFAAGSRDQLYITIFAMFLLAMLLSNTQLIELGKRPSVRCLNQLFDPVLRAMLYQTFVLPKRPSRKLVRVYSLLFCFSFLSYNIYIAQLEMVLVHPPRAPVIRSYQDLRNAGLKILMSPDDSSLMQATIGRQHMSAYRDVYEIVNRSIFQTLRRQTNSSYAYPITHTLWPLIKRKFIKHPYPAFRLSEEFTFLSLVPFVLPLPKNSIYEAALNRYILNTHCSGLYALWFHQTFQKLAKIGKIEQLPYQSPKDCFHILRWKDLSLVWSVHFCLILIASMVFVFEVGLSNVQQRRP